MVADLAIEFQLLHLKTEKIVIFEVAVAIVHSLL